MKALAAGLTAGVGLMVAGLLGVVGLGLAFVSPSQASTGSPSPEALADIPSEVLALYQEAAAETCNMPWQVLAAVGKVELDHGRSSAPGVRSGANGAGAMGPMQFLGGTWAGYGRDGDGDGRADVYNPADAIWGAANYLCANGAGDPARLRDAIWNYNHLLVRGQDSRHRGGVLDGRRIGSGDVASLLSSPNLTLSPGARQDLARGVVDQRLVDFLAWATQRHHLAVSVIKTGHARFVRGTSRVSNHWHGRGVDIAAVEGEPVNRSSAPARLFALEVVALAPPGRPTELGVPWGDLRAPGVFSDGDHQGHIHAGWSGKA